MGFIYKITSLINGKIYIGQTITSISQRMNRHYTNAKTNNHATGIDGAIKKYGRENFKVEEICRCPNEDLDAQEQFYIAKYDSFNNGYNLTIGGKEGGTTLNLNEQNVINKYLELLSIKETAKYFNCSVITISNILHNNNIQIIKPITNPQNLLKGKKFKEGEGTKKIKIIELNKVFNSMKDCAIWLMNNNYTKANSMEMTRKSLSRAIHSNKTYCKLHFKFL